MRLFLAINLPADVRSDVLNVTAPLRAAAPELSWVDDSRIHLTLKFLGEQDESGGIIERLARGVDLVAYTHRMFTMRLGGIGAFPGFRRARVVWLGIAAEPRLELLHHDVEVACEELGFAVEGRPFRPHLTLARASEGVRDEETMRRLSRAAKQIDYEAEVPVRSRDVMRSELAAGTELASGRRGARYQCLHSATLRAN